MKDDRCHWEKRTVKRTLKTGTTKWQGVLWSSCLTLILLSGNGQQLALAGVDGMAATTSESWQLDAHAIPLGWVPIAKPYLNRKLSECVGYAVDREWAVSGEKEVKITHWEPSPQKWQLPFELDLVEMLPGAHAEVREWADVHTMKLDRGWLVGVNAGEWGGGLWWFDEEAGRGRKIWGEDRIDNGLGFVSLNGRTLALAGYNHQGYYSGRLLQVRFMNSRLDVGVVTDFGAAPVAWFVEDNALFVLTHRGLHRTSHSSEEGFTGLTTKSLTSMVKLSSGLIYIGMRFFVLCLIPEGEGYRELWLVPEECQRFEVRDFRCVCLGQPSKQK